MEFNFGTCPKHVPCLIILALQAHMLDLGLAVKGDDERSVLKGSF